jgi:hypothetical protein
VANPDRLAIVLNWDEQIILIPLIDAFYEDVILAKVSEFLAFRLSPSNSRFVTPADSGFALGAHDKRAGQVYGTGQRQIVEACRGIGMVWAEHLFSNLQSLLIKRFGSGVLAQIFVKLCQIGEACCRIGMLRTKRLLADLQPVVSRSTVHHISAAQLSSVCRGCLEHPIRHEDRFR